MSIVVAIIQIIFLFLVAWSIRKREEPPMADFFWPALLLKLVSGFMLGWLYAYYYPGGDTFNYFHDSTKLSALAREDFNVYLRFLWYGNESFPVWESLTLQEHRSLFMTKCLSVFALATMDNYWITSLYFSFISFSGGWFLVKNLTRLVPQSMVAGVLTFLFLPSVVFWSSGVIKESLAMAMLFFMSALFLKGWYKERINIFEWILVIPAAVVFWKLKYFYAGVFFPVAVTSLVVKHLFPSFTKTSHVGSSMLLWTGIFTGLLFLSTLLHPNFNSSYFFDVIVLNYKLYENLSTEQGMIHYYNLQPTVGSIFINAPKAFFSGLFRPFIWEASSPLQFLSAVENAVLLIVSFTALRNFKKYLHSENFMLAFAVMVYVVVVGVFLSLSTPNFGTLSRYRIGFLPYYVFIVVYDNPIIARPFERFFSRLAR